MSSDEIRKPDQADDDVRLDDLPARSPDKPDGVPARPSRLILAMDDDVIPIEDLTPRENVKGGRKVILGEVATRPEDTK